MAHSDSQLRVNSLPVFLELPQACVDCSLSAHSFRNSTKPDGTSGAPHRFGRTRQQPVLTDIVVLSVGLTAQLTTAIVWFVFKDRGICYHWPMRNTQSRAGSKEGDNERMWVQWQMPESYHQQCSQVLNIKQLFWKLLERIFTEFQDNINDFRRKNFDILTIF